MSDLLNKRAKKVNKNPFANMKPKRSGRRQIRVISNPFEKRSTARSSRQSKKESRRSIDDVMRDQGDSILLKSESRIRNEYQEEEEEELDPHVGDDYEPEYVEEVPQKQPRRGPQTRSQTKSGGRVSKVSKPKTLTEELFPSETLNNPITKALFNGAKK